MSPTVIADNCEKSLVESLITISLTSCRETKADVETYLLQQKHLFVYGWHKKPVAQNRKYGRRSKATSEQ